ncbi:MAG: DUF1800 domain-containing protein [Saprospiraceae bacterium]|nr:DUF1800 domain-containing protein [Saprospiraceae bacterium]
MDRRQLLQSLTLKSTKLEGKQALPVAGGLDKYTGSWDYANAAHLLRRAMFGPTHEQIKQAVTDGLDATIEKLFTPTTITTKPLHYVDTIKDPFCKQGESWVGKSFTPSVQGLNNIRDNSFFSWILQNIFNEGVSINEKMMLFWHNHFVVSEIFLANVSYQYYETIRKNVLGNFKELTKNITIDGAMLNYLNGNTNVKGNPNENYARELLELFTLGKGDLAGPGDYTTYTEHDILEIAKVLTGWVTLQNRKNEKSTTDPIDPILYATTNPSVAYNINPRNGQRADFHETGLKILSHRFNYEEINNLDDKEYAYLIDIIFKKREAATFICRKLYRYFVYYKVDQNIENEIIDQMADQLIADGFAISKTLKKLFSSQHFFSQEAYGALIRSPYEWLFNTAKSMKMKLPTDYKVTYPVVLTMHRALLSQDQAVFNLPSVAGWPAYYQEPAYHEIWVNSVTYPLRYFLGNLFVNKIFGIGRAGGPNAIYGIEVVEYVEGFDDPTNVTKLIDDIVAHLLPKAISQKQKDFLKSKLLATVNETQWAAAWNRYKADPGNQNKIAVEIILRPFFISLLSMPEYHLS